MADKTRTQYVHLTPKALWIEDAIKNGADFADALFLADTEFTADGLHIRRGSILEKLARHPLDSDFDGLMQRFYQVPRARGAA